MALMRVDDQSSPINRSTHTQPAETMDDYIGKISTDLINDGWNYVDIGQSIPIIIDNVLYYTVTLTAGKF